MPVGGSYFAVGGGVKVLQPVAGTVNGMNTVFTVAETFIHDGSTDEAVYLRGLARDEGVGKDYVASESGGIGTGYDTITFTQAPRPGDVILITYYPD